MKTRKSVIKFCFSLPDVFEDYPFHDANWTVMRHKRNRKTFALIFEKDGHIWVNVKRDINRIDFYRDEYESVIPAYHMNKVHWNSIILDGTVPDSAVKDMIEESFYITKQ